METSYRKIGIISITKILYRLSLIKNNFHQMHTLKKAFISTLK